MLEIDKSKVAEILERHGVAVGYLFGSAAHGTMGPHSDIDVAVLFDEKKVPVEKQFDVKIAISSKLAEAFEVNDADVINLSTTVDPLIKYVAVLSGELVLAKDTNKRLALERKVVRDYEDTRTLRRIAGMVMEKQLKDGTFGRFLKTS